MIQGANIHLRALEPDDLAFLNRIENDTGLWQVGELHQPLSRFTLQAYLENAHQSIAEAGQMRLAICNHDQQLIGLVDLFDYEARHQRAGVGIVIDRQFQQKGLAKAALQLLAAYAKDHLLLHQLHCHIQASNAKSIHVFESVGFVRVGVLKDWLRTTDGFEDVLQFQRLL